MKQPDIYIEYIFRCLECGETCGWSMARVPDNGSPSCCDRDMVLADACPKCRKVLHPRLGGGRCTGCGYMLSSKSA